ncbi:MAG TPA: regulatory protein RecX [Longimicrobiales bacterium]|nr:regulatory protein RecX [Longimicrobiales bacterium]
MPRITAIRRHLRRERVRLYVEGDDEPRAELALDLVLRAGLAPGDELGERALEELLREDESFRARDAALSLLSHRARSRAELRRRLGAKQISAGVVDRTVEWLVSLGYLDDAGFADAFIRDRLRLRPRGRMGLLSELRRKGVDERTAAAAIDRVLEAEGVDELALARDAAEAWARKNRTVVRKAAGSREHRQRARRRLYGHLARRGFAPDAVVAGIDRVLGD